MSKKQRTSEAACFVLESASDAHLVESVMCMTVDASYVKIGSNKRQPCWLQCTLETDGFAVNVWQTSTFNPATTKLSDVFDVQLCPELTLYPVILQTSDSKITQAKMMRAIVKHCCRSSTLTEASMAVASTTFDVPMEEREEKDGEGDEEDEEDDEEDDDEEDDKGKDEQEDDDDDDDDDDDEQGAAMDDVEDDDDDYDDS